MEKVISEFGKIDVLVNNAGSSKDVPITEMTDEEDFIVDTDLSSVFKMIRAVAEKW